MRGLGAHRASEAVGAWEREGASERGHQAQTARSSKCIDDIDATGGGDDMANTKVATARKALWPNSMH